MYTNPEQLTDANKANIEKMVELANTSFANVERLTALNINTARDLLEDAVKNTKSLMAAKDAQEFINLQGAMIQPLVEKAVAYNRNVYEIAAQGQEEVAKLFEEQMNEMNKNLSAALDKAAKNAPANSEVIISAAKSAIAAANSAYESVSKAAKQVAEIAENNMNAVTEATEATVKATTKASDKKTA